MDNGRRVVSVNNSMPEFAVSGADERQLQVRDVPGGDAEVGYDVEGNEAYLVARRQIEIGPYDAPGLAR